MSIQILIIIAGITLISFGALAYLMLTGQNDPQISRLRSHSVNAAPVDREATNQFQGKSFAQVAVEVSEEKGSGSQLTLVKKLKYAQLSISPTIFRCFVAGISVVSFSLALRFLGFPLQAASLFVGPVIGGFIINRRLGKRFKQFDRDYPAFLLSLVGLLKTGMNPMQAMEAAASGLEVGSLVKSEVESMLERMRLGVPEERSIGAFGDDIYHPEIELFVQALLLSRKVGGTLSDTLERLAKQVRKRQQFRSQATAAVGMQRGSIWFIIAVLSALLAYINFTVPTMMASLFTPTGFLIVQGSMVGVLIGLFWIKQVTKIKV